MITPPVEARRPRLTVVSSGNFARGYGGVAYLAEALHTRGAAVQVIAPIPLDQMDDIRRFPFLTRSIYSMAPRSPWLSRRMFHLELALTGAFRDTAWLFSDLSFFREAVAIRRLRPRSKLIHYCAELLTPEEFPQVQGTAFYAGHAGVPDLIIDVNAGRAARRRERFGILQEILLLPNTLPLSEIPPPAPPGTLAQLAGGDLPEGTPVLLYAGGTHAGAALDSIVAAVAGLDRPAFLLAFCHGERTDDVVRFRETVNDRLGPHRGRVCPAVPRQALLACMHEATVGLVTYPYSAAPSWNQLHCAPTKAYECVATGLPIVASANPSLQVLVADRAVGVCAADDSAGALRDAIGHLLAEPARRRAISERATRLFAEELCFERVSPPVVERILDVVRRAAQA